MRGKSVARLPERPAPHLTPRGSLAYYLAAWVCGTFFFATARFLTRSPVPASSHGRPGGFFFQYFYLLATGWPGILLVAFLLRFLARRLGWSRAFPWLFAGGVLSVVLVWAVPAVSGGLFGSAAGLRFLGKLFELNGEDGVALSDGRLWAIAAMTLAGMANALVLFWVDNAFMRPRNASE